MSKINFALKVRLLIIRMLSFLDENEKCVFEINKGSIVRADNLIGRSYKL